MESLNYKVQISSSFLIYSVIYGSTNFIYDNDEHLFFMVFHIVKKGRLMECANLESLLVEGKYVLTMDEEYGVIFDGAIVVENDEIVNVGPIGKIESLYSFDEVIKIDDGVVMPGLVNSHNHMYGILARGIPVVIPPSTFQGFLEEFWWPRVEDGLGRGQIHTAALMSSVEMIKNGTTCSADILEAPNALPGALDVEAKATREVGIRSVLSFEATERTSEENGWKGIEENLSFIKRWNNKRNPLCRGMFCTHTTFTCSAEILGKVRELANQYPAGIHIHLQEGAYESKYCLANYQKLPVEFYEEIGFLGSDLLASQCVHTTPKETKLLRKREVKIAHVPLSNCEVGGGIAPVPDFLKMGLTVGLGTDGFVQDMFEVMRAAFLIHKGNLQDASVMPADTVMRMATIDSARAIGLESSIGSLTPGKKADIITVDLKAPTPVTPENLVRHLVVFGEGSMVQDVIVSGKKIMKNGKMITVNEADVRRNCRDAAESLWKI